MNSAKADNDKQADTEIVSNGAQTEIVVAKTTSDEIEAVNEFETETRSSVTTNTTLDAKSADALLSSRAPVKAGYYLLTYCLVYFVGGCILSSTTLVLPYLQELLNIDESSSSLIYTLSYIGQVTGSLIGGKIVSQTWWNNTHLYPGIFGIIICFLLFFMKYITNYFLMIVIWFIIGIWYGGNQPMFVVYIFRVYNLNGAIMYSRMLLFLSFAQALYSVIYNIKYIDYVWYTIIGLIFIYVVLLIVILPTPNDDSLIQTMAEKVIKEADIEVKEHYDEEGNVDLDITVRPHFLKPDLARGMGSVRLPGIDGLDLYNSDSDHDSGDRNSKSQSKNNSNNNNNSSDNGDGVFGLARRRTITVVSKFFDAVSTDAVLAMSDPLRTYENDLVDIVTVHSGAFANVILQSTLSQREHARSKASKETPNLTFKSLSDTNEIRANINVENLENVAEQAFSKALGLDIGLRSKVPGLMHGGGSSGGFARSRAASKIRNGKGTRSRGPSEYGNNNNNIDNIDDIINRGYTIRRGLSVAAAIDETTGSLVLSNNNSNPVRQLQNTNRHRTSTNFNTYTRAPAVATFGPKMTKLIRLALDGHGTRSNSKASQQEQIASQIHRNTINVSDSNRPSLKSSIKSPRKTSSTRALKGIAEGSRTREGKLKVKPIHITKFRMKSVPMDYDTDNENDSPYIKQLQQKRNKNKNKNKNTNNITNVNHHKSVVDRLDASKISKIKTRSTEKTSTSAGASPRGVDFINSKINIFKPAPTMITTGVTGDADNDAMPNTKPEIKKSVMSVSEVSPAPTPADFSPPPINSPGDDHDDDDDAGIAGDDDNDNDNGDQGNDTFGNGDKNIIYSETASDGGSADNDNKDLNGSDDRPVTVDLLANKVEQQGGGHMHGQDLNLALHAQADGENIDNINNMDLNFVNINNINTIVEDKIETDVDYYTSDQGQDLEMVMKHENNININYNDNSNDKPQSGSASASRSRRASTSMQYTDLMYSTATYSELPGLDEIEQLDDELSDCTRKGYVYLVLFLFSLLYFYEGFMLAFAPGYCINQLKYDESKGIIIGAQLISSYYIGSLPGRVIAAFIFKFIKYSTMAKIIQFIVLLTMIVIVFVQIAWNNNGNNDNFFQISNDILLSILFVLYGTLGFCRNVGFSSIFGLISSVHPVTALVGTGDAIARACANAIAGFGIGTCLELFGFYLMPYIALVAAIAQVVFLTIILIIHSKAIKIQKEKETLVAKSMRNLMLSKQSTLDV